MRFTVFALTLFLSLACLALASEKPYLLENFENGWGNWVKSRAVKSEGEDVFQFDGEWKLENITTALLSGDTALVAATAAKHHAISLALPSLIHFDGTKDFVLQYEVKLQNLLDCGGAYIKLISGPSYDPKLFDGKTPYTIMFGPDRCGNTNKVHFIFRHVNPLTKEIEEKHLTRNPSVEISQVTQLYTLIVRPDNSFSILINQEEVRKGNLLEDFFPPVNPPKEIEDPNDKKPDDWVDEAKIPDPNAVKPDDWDESIPMYTVDFDAKKPVDWLDDEPLTIPDPKAAKPADWSDEDDGEWEPPMIENPKCREVSGCGPWERPLKRNPNYKGKWYPALIDNPAYKGPWMPKIIPNPYYFNDEHPNRFMDVAGVGFEIWTMTKGISFDNIYLGSDVEGAKEYAEKTWRPKYIIEVAQKEAEQASPSIFSAISDAFVEFIEKVKEDPMVAISAHPLVALSILLTPIILAFVFIMLFVTSDEPSANVQQQPAPNQAIAEPVSDTAATEPTENEKEEPEPEENVSRSRVEDAPASTSAKKDTPTASPSKTTTKRRPKKVED